MEQIVSAFFRFEYTPFALALVLTSLVALTVAWQAWRRRDQDPSAKALALLMLSAAIWVLAYSLEMLSVERVPMVFWETIATISQAFMGPLWLLLGAHYSSLSGWLNRRRMLVVFFPAILTVLLASTNAWHNLLWSALSFSSGARYSVVIPLAGPWFWALAIYRYVYVLVGTGLIYIPLARSPASYSKHGILIAAGGLLPLAGNALHIFNLTQAMLFDVGPLAYVISGVALYLGLFTYRLLDVLPLAQHVIFESMPEGIVVLDHAGEMIDLNPAARRMLDTREAVLPIHAPLHDILREDLGERLSSAIEGKGEFSVGFGPSLRWLKPLLWPLTDTQGQDRGRLLVLYDVTEARNLAQLREDLMHMMVHDLRNPLSIAQGSLELLVDSNFTQLDATARQLVEMVQRSNEQCLEIVRKILDLQQLESGQMAVDKENLLLLPFVNQLVRQMLPLSNMKQQSLAIEIPHGLPPVLADPRLLQRILQNLVGNAIKFTPNGGSITIGARLTGGYMEISVADTGPGISATLRRDLFGKFVTGAHRNKGSGLGLAFCKLGVEAHGGSIWVESEEHQGSVFRFTLPLHDLDSPKMQRDETVPMQLSLLGQDAGQFDEPLG